jgi:hypothetical protein
MHPPAAACCTDTVARYNATANVTDGDINPNVAKPDFTQEGSYALDTLRWAGSYIHMLIASSEGPSRHMHCKLG